MQKAIVWIRAIFWLVVVVLTFCNMMMLSMDLMAIGMFLEAVNCLYTFYHQK
ncbi:hypothetical protein [Limosilactobacillus frumenti]|nr:hypothetical protein [Limosilactobacillus frumenti]MBA2914725.1 hypothetical protein [Limosilactobacillus frumenti]